MPYWYHGTTPGNAATILKDGFKKGSYFSKELVSSLVMGGEHIFWAWFDKDPTKCWEYISEESVGPERVAYLTAIKVKQLYYSKEMDRYIKEQRIKEEHGDDVIFCEHCWGHGQMEQYPIVYRGKKKVTACPICGGFGCTRKDGRKMNE